ncbi:MAG: M23 family metallopeptidase, partial [Prevotella sp.]|nr:M23 family metallopeptidase [Prevotella sp.]
NRMYSKVYAEMEQKDRLLSDVVAGLEMRDNEIYKGIFKTDAPSLDMISSFDPFFDGEKYADEDLEAMTADRLLKLETYSSRIEDNFRQIFARMNGELFEMPPMSLPLEDFNYNFTGASVGMKINPFYKVMTQHDWMDLIVPSGTPVHAAGKGVVTKVTRSAKGEGNVVEISHLGGFVTRYAHFAKNLVTNGQHVDENTVIGNVGVSGVSFAPHLHYEVIRDGKPVDPVNYYFSNFTPDDYVRMLVMAATIGQSMD